MKKKRKNKKKYRASLGVYLLTLFILIIFCIVLIHKNKLENKPQETSNGESNDVLPIEKEIEEEELYVIETQYCNLYYPKKWNDVVKVEISAIDNYTVSFSAQIEDDQIYSLFDVKFDCEEGVKLGYLKNEEKTVQVNIVMQELLLEQNLSDKEENMLCQMQEDANYLIYMFEQEKAFTMNK